MESLFRVRELAVMFIKYKKKSQKIFVSTDQILSGLRKKLNYDSTIAGGYKYIVEEDIKNLTNTVVKNEQDISKSLVFLNKMQEELCLYLLNYNQENIKRNIN
jgi:hypothetical protein